MKKAFDVVVAGAGPAGIAAAVTAAAQHRRVALVDDNQRPGGQIWRSGASLPRPARVWLSRLEASAVEHLSGTRIFDHPAPGVLCAEWNETAMELHYEKLVFATGARELFLPFPGWTLPNVMGAGGLDAMVRGGLPVAGKRVVVAGTGPLLLAVAAHLAARGAKIVAICEQAPFARLAKFAAQMSRYPGKLLQGLAYRLAARHSRLYCGCWPISASGSTALESLTLRQGNRTWSVACDYLACGFHLVPNLELAELLGCRIQDGFVAVDDLQQTSVANVYCAGEPTGIGGVEMALVEGQIAGLAASGSAEAARKLIPQRRRMLGFVDALRRTCALNPELRRPAADTTLVCRCEDVPFGTLREHTSWRDAKLHTRCGMGPCQGRICGAAAEFLFGWGPDAVRPPIFPALVSSLAAESTNPNKSMEDA